MNEVFINLWFGNFYEPAYSDKSFIRQAMTHIRSLGFDHIQLDSKAWEDFAARFRGEDPSPYVAMQEFMMEEAVRAGLSWNFLALYLNGDNLFPHIRFSPPIYGESITDSAGEDGCWYKYWSHLAQQAMADHVRGLTDLYIRPSDRTGDIKAEGPSIIQTTEGPKFPLCSMWDPIAAPSFDKEGIDHYRKWILKRWGSVEKINIRYALALKDIQELEPGDYWFDLSYPGKSVYSRADMENKSRAYCIWVDNAQYKSDVISQYFKDMRRRLMALNEDFYLVPNLAQWGYFLNIDGRKTG